MYAQEGTPNQRAPLVNVETTSHLKLIRMLYLTHIIIHQHIFIIRFAQAIPTRKQTTRTNSEVLCNNCIVHYAITDSLQGANVESKVIE